MMGLGSLPLRLMVVLGSLPLRLMGSLPLRPLRPLRQHLVVSFEDNLSMYHS
jgi:hypothetical protein